MNQVLLVGATSAIAQALARQLAAKGARLVLWGRSQRKLEIVAEDLRVRYGAIVSVTAFDFSDFSQHRIALEKTIAESGDLDVAVICHGSLGNQAACQENFSLT